MCMCIVFFLMVFSIRAHTESVRMSRESSLPASSPGPGWLSIK